MRRILVPLDGSRLATSIIPDARRLAGPDGELVLVHDVVRAARDPETGRQSERAALDRSYDYLEAEGERLRAEGIRARAETLVIFDVARGIDEAAKIFNADMIACATHGRSSLGRLIRGSVAWRVMAHSHVPVLLRHPEDAPGQEEAVTGERRIMVPLDGSDYSEKALPLAAELAREWQARVYLTQVLPDPFRPGAYGEFGALPLDLHREMNAVKDRLNDLAERFPVPTQTHVSCGGVVENLVEDARDWQITDIVMASHGRTGLSRVIIGSVTDALIQRLHCPIIVIPSLVAETAGEAVSTGTRNEPAGVLPV